METLGNPSAAVMIGDNPIADGQGALQAGLQPLLVHGCYSPVFELWTPAAQESRTADRNAKTMRIHHNLSLIHI